MKFEEMKKIWDAQNNKPLYAIDEDALHSSILSKKNKGMMIASINEIGLFIIGIAVGIYLIIKSTSGPNVYAFLPAIGVLFTTVYVLLQRKKRKKIDRQFDRSILGDLDHAITNANYHVNFARTFVWWYITPVAIPLFINMYMNNAPAWKWLFVPAALFLGYWVVNYELKKIHIPRKKSLESLRNKLLEKVNISEEG